MVGMARNYNVIRLNIVAQKNVILKYTIFSQKTFPFHNGVSTEKITTLTEKSIK